MECIACSETLFYKDLPSVSLVLLYICIWPRFSYIYVSPLPEVINPATFWLHFKDPC